MNTHKIKPALYLPSIKNLPIPNFSEFKLPPIEALDNQKNKPYKCDDCQASFNRKNSLLRHQRIHSGAKPYECSNCSKRFSRKDILTRHKDSLKCQKIKSNNQNNQKEKIDNITNSKQFSNGEKLKNFHNTRYEHERYIYEHLFIDNLPNHPLLLSNYKQSSSISRESSPLQLPSTISKIN